MRSIKFRALESGADGRIKMWRYGWLAHNEMFFYIINGITSHGVDEKTVGQFTGLLDKNGKEIYEGDIMRSHGSIAGIVFYQAPSFVIKKTEKAKTWHEFILSPDQNQFQEVIGNIHENPEFLK